MKLLVVGLLALSLACIGCASDKGAKKEDKTLEEPKNGEEKQGEQDDGTPAWSKFPDKEDKNTEDSEDTPE